MTVKHTTRQSRSRRRATVLVMVVSLLALLFVIVSGFLASAREAREIQTATARTRMTERIAESLNQALVDRMVGTLKSGGTVLGGPDAQFETIPGYEESHWLASLEPVWRRGGPNLAGLAGFADDRQYIRSITWPAMTSMAPTPTGAPVTSALDQLIPESGLDSDAAWDWTTYSDLERYGREPWLDADADGIPDSSLIAMQQALETANAFNGTPISVPRSLNIASIPDVTDADPLRRAQAEAWQRFREQGRYVPATRIVAHGGMVTLDAPPLPLGNNPQAREPFNRQFTVTMFDEFRHLDDATLSSYTANDIEEVFESLAISRGAVEGNLRRRGGVLASPPVLAGVDQVGATDPIDRRARAVPPILRQLQGEFQSNAPEFPRTFLPAMLAPSLLSNQIVKQDRYQLFNLADGANNNALVNNLTERSAALHAMAMDAARFRLLNSNTKYVWETYDRRHALTTTNNSDEIARKQKADEPQVTQTDGNRDLNTYIGEQKFYLGEVAKAFNNATNPGEWNYDSENGRVVVRNLARRFYDMLDSHDDWGSVTAGDNPGQEAVSQRQQAFMLAVNTLGFASPRDEEGTAFAGWIDPVVYEDYGPDGLTVPPTVYVGHAPQPYITEVIAYNDQELDPNDPNADPNDPPSDPNNPNIYDPNDPNADTYIVLGIELFNPNDPDPDTATVGFDRYALNRFQFALSVGEDPNSPKIPLGSPNQRIRGRQFFSVRLEDGDSNAMGGYFDLSTSMDFPFDPNGSAPPIPVRLWRRGDRVNEVWYLVDEIEVQAPQDRNDWHSVNRDTTPHWAFAHADYVPDANAPPQVDEYARWGIVTGLTQVASGSSPSGNGLDNTLRVPSWIGAGGVPVNPDDRLLPQQFAPATPLITANAAPINDMAIFHDPATANPRDLRPRSFPTPGFMLFVPRYSHVTPGTAGTSIPLTEVLRQEWVNKNYTLGNYPGDMGHMPVLDNQQELKAGAPLARYGQGTTPVGLPWGQLVFDYFTTLNPEMDLDNDGQPDVDPLRVPGRVDVNNAPWFVLSRLPVLGPRMARAEIDGISGNGTMPLNLTSDLIEPDQQLPIRYYLTATAGDPSPAFWHPQIGALVGRGTEPVNPAIAAGGGNPPVYRFIANDAEYRAGPGNSLAGFSVPSMANPNTGRYALGPWLAASAAAYRDGVQYMPYYTAGALNQYQRGQTFADSQLRGGSGTFYPIDYQPGGPVPLSIPYRPTELGTMRGASTTGSERPSEFGFLSIGELLNVKGFDQTRDDTLRDAYGAGSAAQYSTAGRGDFVKAVGLLALLDTQYLTTRSNTFTIYTTVADRELPEQSLRTQVTVDRSNLLPRLEYVHVDTSTNPDTYVFNPTAAQKATLPRVPYTVDVGGDGIPDPIRTTNDGARPEIVAERKAGYYSSRFDN